MKANFEIDSFTEIIYKDSLIDLHNNFEFQNLEKVVSEKKLVLKFTKSKGDWVKNEERENLTFIMKNTFYELMNFGKEEFEGDSKVLHGISYFPSSMREINDGLMEQRTPKSDEDIVFLFEDDSFIRVACEEIELT